MNRSIRQVLQAAAASLPAADSARLDAEVLLCRALGCDRAHLAAWPEKCLADDVLSGFDALLDRRRLGVPVAYLTGEREFWSRSFKVDESTLIPRPETEMLVEFVLGRLPRDGRARVADLGTGSGVIAISLACERPAWTLIATDNSAAALAVARENAHRHGAGNVSFIEADWLGEIDGPLDAVVSNPPYIPARDPHLQQGDVRFEPLAALAAGDSGLDAIRRISSAALPRLRAGGWLVLEHGHDQQQAVAAVLHGAGYASIIQQRDTAGLPRLSAARRGAD